MGTFHFGYTTDGHSTEFDERNKDNQSQAHEIAKKIAEFKPTVIVVEILPEYSANMQSVYLEYCENPDVEFEHPTELELLAYEVGRLSGVKKIYGIDHVIHYNYQIDQDIVNTLDSLTCKKFNLHPTEGFSGVSLEENEATLIEKLRSKNTQEYLDFMITANADILAHAGTDDNFEGADEAAKFYHRNLRMYSNLNRIPLDSNDRVFILMGAAHTAFFRDFMSRSPKYEMVNTLDFLE